MDHDSALREANQALGGRSSRSTTRFASVELRAVESARPGARPSLELETDRSLPHGAWEFAAMVSVGVVTLLFVVGLWLL